MTIPQAKATWKRLMEKAQGSSLSPGEKRLLIRSTQILRYGRRPASNKGKKRKAPKRNPAGNRRIGRIVAIVYYRDQGRKRGLYKHDFKSRASVYTMADGSIKIR